MCALLCVIAAMWPVTLQPLHLCGHVLHKDELLAEWKRCLADIRSMRWKERIETSLEQHIPPGGPVTGGLVTGTDKSVYESLRTFKRGVGSASLTDQIMSSREKDLERSAWLSNRQYEARLVYTLKSPFWVVTELAESSRNRDELVCPWLVVGNIYLYDWIGDSGFTITNVDEQAAAKGIIRIYFVYDPSVENARGFSRAVKSGYIDLNIEQCYRPEAFEYQLEAQTMTGWARGSWAYLDQEGLPVPMSESYETEIIEQRKGRMRVVSEKRYSDVTYNGDIDDSQFTLSYFGLPEILQAAKKPTRWFLWLTLAGVAFLAVGAFFYYRARRRA